MNSGAWPPSPCFDYTDGVCMVPTEVGAALSTFRVSFLTNTPSTVSVRSTTPRCGPAVAHHILQRTRADVLGYRVHPCSGSSRAAGPWVADDCSHVFSCLYEGTSLRMEHLYMCVCACVHGTCCVTFPDSSRCPLALVPQSKHLVGEENFLARRGSGLYT